MGNFNRGGGRDFGRRDFGGDRREGFNGRDSGRREMFNSVCSNCGKDCQIPFKPTGGKPVYCSDCFEKMGGGRDSRRPGRSDFRPQNSGSDQNRAQLDAINAKLDKILGILNPTPVVKSPEVAEPVKVEKTEKMEEIKAEKTKKKVKKIASKKK